MLSSNALRTFARRAASSNTARRFASSGAGAAGAGAETQSAQQTAAYITAGALVVSMACVSQAGQKVRGWIDIYVDGSTSQLLVVGRIVLLR